MSQPARAMVEIGHLHKHFGAETAVKDVNLDIGEGEFVTLLGPSGCGKTTTLRCVAGLEKPDGGEIKIGGQLVAAPGKDVYMAPEKRNIGMVFQSYAVWPHMTVFENVAYGLRVRRASAADIKKKTTRALELVGLAHLADRFATKLSGGQRQRVALARAIVYEPRVVLYDEPLSNLDAKLREQMRVELVRLQKEVGLTAIYVTHDQSEALVMSDRVVVMDKAIIQQIGDPRAIYAKPANAFVAGFIGVANLLKGTVKAKNGDVVDVSVPLVEHLAPIMIRATGGEAAQVGHAVSLCVRPEDVTLHTFRPSNVPAGNLIEGLVIDTVYLGSHLECRVRAGDNEIAIQIGHFEQLARGQRVYLTFAPEHALCLTA